MSAASTDKFRKLARKWVGQIGAGGVADASTATVPLSSSTNLATDTGIDLVIDRVNSAGAKTPLSEESIIGVVSGNNIVTTTRGTEGTAQAHVAGAVVESLVTAKGWNDLIDGILVSHGQDGTLKSGLSLTLPQINDTSADHQYVLSVCELAADRTVALPLLTGDDEFVFKNHTQTLINKTLTTPVITNPRAFDGWNDANETWTYVGADDPTFTFKISGVDLTSKYSAGMRIKLTQTTVKYFIITAVTFSTDTTITVYGGTDYDLVDAAISANYYSSMKAPQGFPVSPIKWTVEATDTSSASQATPTQNAWYNLGSVTISIPIGVWDLSYQVYTLASINSATDLGHHKTTLSTANNSESDADFTVAQYQQVGSANQISAFTANRRKTVLAAAKTSYYLNASVTIASVASIAFRGDASKTIIRAICAYL